MSEEEKKPKKIVSPLTEEDEERLNRARLGTVAAFKFAEDSRRDKDRE